MNKLVLVLAVLLSVSVAVPAVASDKPKRVKPAGGVTLSHAQFMALLAMVADRPAPVSVPGSPGAAGVAGAPGQRGEVGAPGLAGAAGAAGAAGVGERGADGAAGAAGADGVNGRDGVGFAPGVVFLVNGACPGGSTLQGPQNRWTVYANDTTGRPWTTTGSSAQLFLSACQVD